MDNGGGLKAKSPFVFAFIQKDTRKFDVTPNYRAIVLNASY